METFPETGMATKNIEEMASKSPSLALQVLLQSAGFEKLPAFLRILIRTRLFAAGFQEARRDCQPSVPEVKKDA